jgi:glycerophosphoryl diester phosphodiesterase
VSFADRVVVIGHRGAAGLEPENTLPSFRRAFECGVSAVELDVQAIAGELLVIHDDTLDRTTNGRGPVAALDPAALRALDAGGGWPIPLLSEVTEILPPGVGLNIELKGPATARPVAEFLAARTGLDVLVSSFDHEELRHFQALAPGVPVAPLFSKWNEDVWRIAAGFRAWSVNLSRRIVNASRLADARREGFRTLIYTVNEPAEAARWVALGATGVFTDFPDRITPDAPGG